MKLVHFFNYTFKRKSYKEFREGGKKKCLKGKGLSRSSCTVEDTAWTFSLCALGLYGPSMGMVWMPDPKFTLIWPVKRFQFISRGIFEEA